VEGRRGLVLAVSTKTVLAAIVLASLFAPDLRDFSARGIAGRAAASVLAIAVVPVWWWVSGRRRGVGYPFAIDALLPVPLIVDYLGKAFDPGDVAWSGRGTHALDFAVLATVVVLALVSTDVAPWVLAALTVGACATAAIVWELLEYASFEREETVELYGGSLEDLAIALAVSVLVASVAYITRRFARER
jgi:hypothetical protein